MKKKKNRKTFFIVIGVLFTFLIVAAGTAASVFAYRQLSDREEDASRITFSSELNEILQDEPLNEDDAHVHISEKGVLVTGVDPESPAAEAGIRRGSIILEIDGVEVNSFRELSSALGEHSAGDTVVLSVLNCETPEDISVTLASSGPYLGVEISGHPGMNFMFDFDEEFPFLPEMPRGFEHRDYDPLIPDLPGIPEDLTPMDPGFPGMPRHFDEFPFDHFPEEFDFMSSTVILEVIPDTPADTAGLEVGDIIKAIDGQEVKNSEEIVEAITEMQPGDTISINVERDGESLDLTATLNEHPEVENQAHLGIHIGSLSLHREYNLFEEEQNS